MFTSPSCHRKLQLMLVLSAIAGTWSFVGMMLVSSFQLLSPVLVYTDGGFPNPTARAGEVVKVLRVIEVQRDVSVIISRAMIRESNGSARQVYNLPTFNMVYEQGTYRQHRDWQIPMDLILGNYNLHNTACYYEFGMFQRCIKLPLLPVEIVQ